MTMVKQGDHTHPKLGQTGDRRQTPPSHRVNGVKGHSFSQPPVHAARTKTPNMSHIENSKDRNSPRRLLNVGSQVIRLKNWNSPSTLARSGRRERRYGCVVQKFRHHLEIPRESQNDRVAVDELLFAQFDKVAVLHWPYYSFSGRNHNSYHCIVNVLMSSKCFGPFHILLWNTQCVVTQETMS